MRQDTYLREIKLSKDEPEVVELRKKLADWNFIRKQPLKVRKALELFIETGDLRACQHKAGLSLEEFMELLRKARIWIT